MSLRISSIICAIAAGPVLFSLVAGAGDLATKAPAMLTNCAVDGPNGKVSGFGGSAAGKGLAGGTGSFALPLGCEFGVQIDGTAASLDHRFLGVISGHAFWRDPSKALFGLYGSYAYWNQVGGIRVGHIGPEGELYLGNWTLQGIAGVEFGNTASGLVGGVPTTYDMTTRFFDQVNLAYYLQDDFKIYTGHRYLNGKNALALGGEYGIALKNGVMLAPFAEARLGEGQYRGLWGGLKFYFGQKNKTLIRRHREDDPPDYGTDFAIGAAGAGVANPSSTNGPLICAQDSDCGSGQFCRDGLCVSGP